MPMTEREAEAVFEDAIRVGAGMAPDEPITEDKLRALVNAGEAAATRCKHRVRVGGYGASSRPVRGFVPIAQTRVIAHLFHQASKLRG